MKTHSILNKIIIIIIGLLAAINISAQESESKKDNLKFSYSPYYGKYIARPEAMLPFDNTPYIAQEFKMGYQTDGSKTWEAALNCPYYGVALYNGHYLENYDGSLFGGFLFIDIPLLTLGKNTIETSIGMGVTLNCNKYNIPDYPEFMEGSSYANVYSHVAVGYLYSINSHFNIGCDVRFQHFSNGGWQYPNNGLEMTSGAIKVQYTPNAIAKKSSSQTTEEKHPLTVCYVAGVSGQDVDIKEKYFNTSLSIAYSVIEKSGYALSCGIDGTYNGYVNIEQSPSDISPFDVYSSGLFVANEIIAGKCRLGVQIGTYIYNGKSFNSPIYERLTIRYHIKERPFVHFGIKMNGPNSQFLEWGFGYKI